MALAIEAPFDAPPLPELSELDHGRLGLSGDGSPQAARLLAAAAAERAAAVARLEARFPGCDVDGMAQRAGVEPMRLLRDLDAGADDLGPAVEARLDRFAAAGDLHLPQAGIVQPNDPNTHPLPEGLLTPLPPDGQRMLEPFPTVQALGSARTFVFNSMEAQFGGAVQDVVEDLALALRSQVQVNAYLSRGVAPGFGLHWDDHDVLVTQVRGRKYWEVHRPAHVGAVRHFTGDDAVGDVAWSGIMAPGTAIWIPRGWGHAVQGFADETSVHLTFGIKRATLVEALALLDHDRFPNLVPDLGATDLEHAVADWRSRLVCFPRNGPIEVGEAIDARFAGWRLRARLLGGVVFAVDRTTDEDLVLIVNRRQMSLPRVAVEVLAWLLEHPWATVAELAAVAEPGIDLHALLAGFGATGLLALRREP